MMVKMMKIMMKTNPEMFENNDMKMMNLKNDETYFVQIHGGITPENTHVTVLNGKNDENKRLLLG